MNKIFILFLLCSLSLIAGVNDKANLSSPKIDKRVELLSIVFRLAGNREYSDDQYKIYTDDIHKYFDKYKGHELITFAQEVRNKNGVAFDAVMKMAIHLEPPPSLNPIIPFTSDIPDGRWGKENAAKFVNLLQQFYLDTKFESFFASHEQLYQSVQNQFKKVYNELDIDWYYQFYGEKPKGNLNIVLGLGNGGGNYGVKIIVSDGIEDTYAIIGTGSLDSLGQPKYNVNDNLPLLVHEFNHSFINYMMKNYQNEFNEAGSKLYDIIKQNMNRRSYGSWQTMMNEALVRASVIRYLMKHNSDSNVAKKQLVEEFNNGFFWIKGLVECLGEYEKNRTKYPTLESFVPNLITYYTGVAKECDVMFDIKE